VGLSGLSARLPAVSGCCDLLAGQLVASPKLSIEKTLGTGCFLNLETVTVLGELSLGELE
jgi:hypothetical protein